MMIAAISYNVCLNRNGYQNRRGERQVVVELYQQGRRRVINTGVHVVAGDFAKGRVQPSHPDHDLLNRRLRRIVRRLMTLEDEMLERDVEVTPQSVAEAYLNHQTPTATVSEWVDQVIMPSERRERTKGNYRVVSRSLEQFRPGLTLGDLSHDLLERWRNWMRSERQLTQNTISLRLKTLRCLVSEAVKRDVIRADRDPFRRIRIPEITARHEHLTADELHQLEEATLSSRELLHVRDAFLFCCYTGLRWGDFSGLTASNVTEGVLTVCQQKTGTTTRLPLALLFGGRPLAVLRRYGTPERLAAVGDNHRANQLLRKVGTEAGITPHLHWHLGRHTCATLLNQQGLRMQEIQYILGHTKQQTTERHYAETVYSQVIASLQAHQ